MYPQEVNVNEKNIDQVIRTYKNAYKQIVSEIANATDFGVANRRAILAQIETILEKLGEDVGAFIEKEIPRYYESGAADAIKQLKNVKAKPGVTEGFNTVHEDAITALVDETAMAFGEGLSGINRQAQQLLGRYTREALTQKIATGFIGGNTFKDIRKQVKGELIEQGLSSFTDRSGRSWTLDRYADMLIRTKAVESRNRGVANRLAENGFDLVQVSSHNTQHAECAVWEGKILSATGKTPGYPTVFDAQNAGLFHPNCKHAINVLNPKLAKETSAYNPQHRVYSAAGASIAGPVKQATHQAVISKAVAYDKDFKDRVQTIASAGNWDYSHGPVKKVARATDKVINDYNGDPSLLRDANRSVIFVKSPAEIDKIVEQTKQIWEIDRVKDGFNVDYVGYKKTMINVKLPGGHVGEIQVTTKEMWRAKKELGGDELYHQVRNKVENWEELEKKMNKLYEDADAAIG